MPSNNWNMMTDFAPISPKGQFLPNISSSSTRSSSDGGGWIFVLCFAVVMALGYFLVQVFAPEANEPLVWIIFGLAAVVSLVLLACGVAVAFNVMRRALGRGLVRLGTWMAS